MAALPGPLHAKAYRIKMGAPLAAVLDVVENAVTVYGLQIINHGLGEFLLLRRSVGWLFGETRSAHQQGHQSKKQGKKQQVA
jgi:hypothetical protein